MITELTIDSLGQFKHFVIAKEETTIYPQDEIAYKEIEAELDVVTNKVIYYVQRKSWRDDYSECCGKYNNIQDALEQYNSLTLK